MIRDPLSIIRNNVIKTNPLVKILDQFKEFSQEKRFSLNSFEYFEHECNFTCTLHWKLISDSEQKHRFSLLF